MRTVPFLSLSATAATTYFLWRYFFPRQARGEFDGLFEPRPSDRLLVVAPHPDDEVLACGGLIHQAVRQGSSVDVVVLTNGDGFALATGRAYWRLRTSPQKFIDFGYLRQRETVEGCRLLGLPSERIHFLGYPDRGLHRMWWHNCWTQESPFRSPFTASTHVPYENAPSVGAPHAGEQVVADLLALLRELRPTMLLGPHPNDVHVDHWSGHNLVRYAWALWLGEEAKWPTANTPKYWGYLVHRGNWPAPKGLHLTKPLTPPASMLHEGWRWRWYPLDPESTKLKQQAIQTHRSQVALMRRYMSSFSRVNEMFAPVEPIVVPQLPSPVAWEHTPFRVVNPVKDTVIRRLQGGADIAAIDTGMDGDRLLVRLDLRTHVQRDIEYRLKARAVRPPFDRAGGVRWLTLAARPLRGGEMRISVQVTGREVPSHLFRARYHRGVVIFDLPRNEAGPPLFVAAETRVRGLTADRTGWQLLLWKD